MAALLFRQIDKGLTPRRVTASTGTTVVGAVFHTTRSFHQSLAQLLCHGQPAIPPPRTP